MNWKNTGMQTILRSIAVIVLIFGLGSALLIYLTADNAADGIPGYEPQDSKMYIHDVELYGGKVNVIVSEFVHWFVRLWQGRTLAYTVACITIVISFGFFFAADNLQSDLESDARND